MYFFHHAIQILSVKIRCLSWRMPIHQRSMLLGLVLMVQSTDQILPEFTILDVKWKIQTQPHFRQFQGRLAVANMMHSINSIYFGQVQLSTPQEPSMANVQISEF